MRSARTLARTLIGSIAALLLGVVAAAAQPAPDCRQAKTAAERAICGNAELAASDKAMTQAYAGLRARLPSEQQKALLADQRRWIIRRQAVCGDKSEEALAQCLLAETDADQVWLSSEVADNDIVVRTGGGDDLVHLNNCSAFHDLNINAGAGNDTAELIGDLAIDKIMADLGDGNDTLNVDTLYFSNAANVFLSGGNGFDSLNVKGVLPTHFSQFNKTSFERINGRLVLPIYATPVTAVKAY